MGETQDYLHRIGTVAEFTERYWGGRGASAIPNNWTIEDA